MNKKNFLAIDIGASSGRTILGTLNNGVLEIKELTRFANSLIELNGHFYWNLLSLYEAILEGLKKTVRDGIEISSIGIDTWGVDFIAIDKSQEILGMPYSYRDPHTTDAPENFFKLIPRRNVYESTGIQIMNFNTLYQFYTLNQNQSTVLKEADKVMFMPDALSFMLTKKVVMEYTIASTAQILNPYTKQPDAELLSHVGLDKNKFGQLVMPGTVIGNLSDSVCRQAGINFVPVVAVGGHDTASAVVSVPALDENFAYLSSGTWSLMGIEVKEPIINSETYGLNFTNEGGVDGTIRFLKNICGMWLLEQCRKEWGTELSYPYLIGQAMECKPFEYLINPDAAVFSNPVSMTQAISQYCIDANQEAPQSVGEYVRCIFDSLALRYKQVLESLQSLAPFVINRLYIIGGGSQNKLLNQFTANATGIPVIAGHTEATAIGNIMMQAKALNIVGSLSEIRQIICDSVSPVTYQPENTGIWNEAYNKFNKICNNKYNHEERSLSRESIRNS
ncbi:rhamnulokinase [Dysgonomonas sp.]